MIGSIYPRVLMVFTLTCSGAMPQQVFCQVPELETGTISVKIVCEVTRTYPSQTCQFSWFRNGTETSLASAQNITYQTRESQGEAGYFNPTCTLTYPVQDLGLGSHAFRVRAYPNVTGSSSDTNYGVNSSLTSNVTINNPTVQLDSVSCPQGYVLEGSLVNCSCRETANTFLSFRTSFSQGSTDYTPGLRITTYSFNASRNNMRDFTCQATLLNWTSNSVTYKPQVAYGPKNVTVKVNNLTVPGDISLGDMSQPVTVTVTCTVSVDGVSPGADYEFIINGSRRPANPVGSSSLTYIVTTAGPLSVQCMGSNSVFKDVTAISSEQKLQVIDPAFSSTDSGGKDVGAIAGGVVGGFLAIVLVGVVIFLKKRGICDRKEYTDSPLPPSRPNEDETEEPIVVFDNKVLYATGRESEVVVDNKDLGDSNSKPDEDKKPAPVSRYAVVDIVEPSSRTNDTEPPTHQNLSQQPNPNQETLQNK